MHHQLRLSVARGLKVSAVLALAVACSEDAATNGPGPNGSATGGVAQSTGGVSTGGTTSTTGGTSPSTGGTATSTGGTATSTGGTAASTGGTGTSTGGTPTGVITTGGVSTGGSSSATGGSVATGGSNSATGGSKSGGGSAGVGGTAGTAGRAGVGGGSAGGGSVTPPTGANSIAYIGCSMAWNIGNGYKRVGGKVMWNSDSYQTSAMVVQNWTNANSSSWNLFDQKMNSIGGKDTVKAIMVQICILSSRATDAELKSMVASARQHVNPGTHIYIVGQPQYQAGHECSLAGNGGAKWTDDQAKKLAADSSVNQDMTYLGQFIIDSTKGEVSNDTCHASSSGEDVLGKQAMTFFGG